MLAHFWEKRRIKEEKRRNLTKKRNIEEKEEGSIPLKEFCKVKNKIEENKGNKGTAKEACKCT